MGEAYKEALALPALKKLPPSVKLAELGDAQEMQDLFESFAIATTIGVLCIYAVLFTYVDDAQVAIGKLARRFGLLKHRHGDTHATPQPASA